MPVAVCVVELNFTSKFFVFLFSLYYLPFSQLKISLCIYEISADRTHAHISAVEYLRYP